MASLKATETAAALTSAMAERRLMRLVTRFDEWTITGFVAAEGPGFVMIAVVNDRIWFDGFECFRRPDIIDVASEPKTPFYERALALRGEVMPEPPAVSLASIEALLETAGRAYRLVTIHREEEDPDTCHIGRVHDILGGEVFLQEVTPNAEWETELEAYPTAEITRVAFGADYEAALTMVAGDPPPV
jgi:hypothetical protein